MTRAGLNRRRRPFQGGNEQYLQLLTGRGSTPKYAIKRVKRLNHGWGMRVRNINFAIHVSTTPRAWQQKAPQFPALSSTDVRAGVDREEMRLSQAQNVGCAELPAQPLIDAHSCRFCMQGGRACIGLASNDAAGQITRLLHRFLSFACFACRLERDGFTAIILSCRLLRWRDSQRTSSDPILASCSPKYLKYFREGEHNWTDCPALGIVRARV
jgi:hypothetical protein